jgi:hypothetical protein
VLGLAPASIVLLAVTPRALHDHVLRTAHNHSGGRCASSTVLRLHGLGSHS